jgi:pentatricopeptide repeat protein
MCVEVDQPKQAVALLDEFDRLHLPLDTFSFGLLTRACCMSGDVTTVKKLIHRLQTATSTTSFTLTAIGFNQILQTLAKAPQGSYTQEDVTEVLALMDRWKIGHDSYTQTALIGIYAKHGNLEQARHVLDHLVDQKNIICWSAMVAAYTEKGQGKQALDLYAKMKQHGIVPNRVTCLSLLRACANEADLVQGREIHTLLIKNNIELDIILQTALMNMYAKCGSLVEARQIFDTMQYRDLASWNAMLAGYAHQGESKQALELFAQMRQHRDVIPDNVTFVSLVTACAKGGDLRQAREIHTKLQNSGIKLDLNLNNALINMYAKCGSLVEARQVFDNLKQRDVASFNALMAGYVQQDSGQEALHFFSQLKEQGIKPDEISFILALQACGRAVSLKQGKQVHEEVIKSGILPNIKVENTLMDMYGRCGSVTNAQNVFNQMYQRDTVSWNALMRAYGQLGEGTKVLELVEEMQRQGGAPDEITWTIVLFSCSHQGLIEEGLQIFRKVQADRKVVLTEHN